MRRALLCTALGVALCASIAGARGGKYPIGVAIGGGSGGTLLADSSYEYVRCSLLPDPPFTPVAVTTADDLHDVVTANCLNGCILDLAAGTYTDTNVTVGPGSDTSVKGGSLNGTAITGEILIRAADPSNKPLLRAEIGNPAGIFYFINNTKRVRLENLVLDGRRSEQTAAAVSVCTDTTPANDICDTGSQTSSDASAFYTNSSNNTKTRSCLLNIDVIETIDDAFEIRDAVATTVENATVRGAGCAPSTCPALDIPADAVTNSIRLVGRGVNFIESQGVAVVNSTIDDVTKSGIQCFGSFDCLVIGNRITNALQTGIVSLGSESVIRRNRIESIGLNYAHNTLADNTGHGIHHLDNDPYTGDLSSEITENTIINTFSSGVFLNLRLDTPADSAIVSLQGNSSTGACNGTTRILSAAFELGDTVDDYQAVYATGNTVTDSGCAASFRIENVLSYVGKNNVISGGPSTGIVFDTVADITDTGLDSDGNIVVDAASAGAISNCTLNGAATVTGSLAGAVTRTDCGPDQGGSPSSNWGELEWDLDDWG